MNSLYNTHRNLQESSYLDTNKKTKPSTLIFMGVVFLIVGILLTIVNFCEYQDYHAIADDGNSTTAYVTNVESKTTKTTTRSRHRTKSGRRRKKTTTKTYYYVTATYTVDNQNYSIDFKSDSSYSQGETITVFYEEGNPSNYVREGDDGDSLAFGIALTILGGIFGGIGLKKYRDEKDLKAMGLL
ncbi:MAG: DUF3592 domain-containing protein [Acutalibacteraceae bacterium]|nr:DUF3592 domain-containing protein [Acutalibacteraceae bacterium]